MNTDVALALALVSLLCSFVAMTAASVGFVVIRAQIQRQRDDALWAEIRWLKTRARHEQGI